MDEALEAVTRGMDAARKEVFERVWRRVMDTGGAEDAPLLPTPETPAEEKGDGTGEALLPAARPAPPEGSDFPRETGVLGESCQEWAGLLQGLIRAALTEGKALQALSARAAGRPGRALAALAAEKTRQARELAAVCFLITGVRFWPEPGKAVPARSYLGELRQRFRRGQESMAAYLAGAELVTDPCLRALFLRHARDQWDQGQRLRALVEQGVAGGR